VISHADGILKGKSERAPKSAGYVYLFSSLVIYIYVSSSWTRSRDDGSYLCCDALRNDQVRSMNLCGEQYLKLDVYRTKLIDDAKRPNPQYRGLIHGTAAIVRQEGISGIYRGLFPVVCKIYMNRLADNDPR
jgi:Mitochondrial carrier protein